MPRSAQERASTRVRPRIAPETALLATIADEARHDVLSAFADSIELAHRHGPDRWGLRLSENNLMLKVGPHEVLQAYAPGRFHMIVDSASVPNRLRLSPELLFSGTRDYYGNSDAIGYYPSNPGTEACDMDALRTGAWYPRMLESHEEVIRRAARLRRHPSTQQSHAPEAVAAISRHLGRALPQPAYAGDSQFVPSDPPNPTRDSFRAHPSQHGAKRPVVQGAIAGVPREQIDHVFRWSVVLSTAEYVVGFRMIATRLSELQRQLLKHLYNAPDRAAYATQLAKWARVKGGHSVVNLRFGAIGHLFSDATGHRPDLRSDESPRWWSIIALGHHTKYGFIWQMLPEVAEALQHLGWVEPVLHTLPEEVPNAENLLEGAVCRVSINAYERNPAARQRCIAHYGTTCVVCGFDFGKRYGQVAHGFIHVHHVVPLSEVRAEYTVDPVRDLRPVCANCHAVIHLHGGCRTIDEMKELLVP